jgi:proteasome lid subunit RPN8/RPN11
LALHLGRAGFTNLILVDTDNLSPHNLVRHGLLRSSVGKNKATALKDELAGTFSSDDSVHFESNERRALNILSDKETLERVQLLIDSTASPAVLGTLVRCEIPPDVHVCKCEMTDSGRLGYILSEGSGRSPRLDDLQVSLYDLALECHLVAAWLQRHRTESQALRGPVLEQIGIGISCSSDTMRLADDVVSFHSAGFSTAIRAMLSVEDQRGRIHLSQLALGVGVSGSILTIPFDRTLTLDAKGGPTWQVRLSAKSQMHLQRLLVSAGRKETGGLLIGMIHRKRKTIYVTRILPPSRDSKGSPYAFRRGVKDYPEQLATIHALTGNLLGYVGEWHTHPSGKAEMSDQDTEAVTQIRSTLRSAGLPAHILIAAPGETSSFVFPTD